MEPCVKCGKQTNTYYSSVGPLCTDCRQAMYEEKILEKSKALTRPSDLEDWDHGDMSELFWIHLGKYIKEPNYHSLNIMDIAFRWACHDSHGLSNSFDHALKWAGIDLYEEDLKWREKLGNSH